MMISIPLIKEELNSHFDQKHTFFIHIEIGKVFLKKEFNSLM